MEEGRLVVLGSISRTHGVKGHVLIRSAFSDIELNIGEPVFVDLQGPVPFFVAETKQSGGNLVLKLDWIDDMDAAEKLVGSELLVEHDKVNEEELDEPFVGWKVSDEVLGEVGEVVEFREMPHQSLLVIASAEGKEMLIPFVEDFVVELKEEDKLILMNLPEGLLDL